MLRRTILVLTILALAVPWTAADSPALSAPTARTAPGSWVWHIETVDSAGNAGMYSSLALDPTNLPRIAYYGGDGDLKFAWHDGSVWHIETVDDAGDVGLFPSLALSVDLARVSYYDSTNGDLKYAQEDFGGWVVETIDTAGDVGAWASLAMDQAGVPHIAYYDATAGNGNLKLAHPVQSGGNCGGGAWRCETVDDSPYNNAGAHASLKLAGVGWTTARIAYRNATSGMLMYAYYAWDGWVTVVVAGGCDGDVSLALDDSGNPHIAYYSLGKLQYAYYDSASWHIETVDQLVTEDEISLALDSQGYPHISFRGLGGLLYAWKDASGWHKQVADPHAYGNARSSLVLDSADRPRISYYNAINADLKYAYACVDALFSAAPVPQCVHQAVVFSNDSRGFPPLSYLWAFGDGITSTLENPVHAYDHGGRYTAWLTATADCGFDFFTSTVIISSTPQADFTFGPLPVCAGQTVQFTNTTVGSPTLSYLWDFDDGSSSSAEHPTHTYALPGLYDVVLMAMNGCGIDTSAQPLQAHDVPSGPDFAVQPDPPAAGRPVNFIGSAQSTLPVSYSWDFGDGATGGGNPITHTYAASSYYTVTMTATGACGATSVAKTLWVCDAPSGLLVDSVPPIPILGDVVTFTAGLQAASTPVTYTFDFGDSHQAVVVGDLTGQVTHTYDAGGYYTVSVTATNACGQDFAAMVQFICVPVDAAAFSWSPSTPTVGFPVAFTGTATGTTPLAYSWDFGDGETASGAVVTHTYAATGTYTVLMTATNYCGVATATRSLLVVALPAAGFESNSPVCLGEPTVFTSTSSGAEPMSFLWSFGDGITSTLRNPTHTYALPGDYTVILTATNPYGWDQVTGTVQVTAPPTDAAITYEPASPDPGAVVTFTAQAAGSEPLAYAWNFGDGHAGAGQVVTHVYALTGTYEALLTVTNACGESYSTETVEVSFCAAPDGLSITYSSPLLAGRSAHFTATLAAGSEPLTYAWDFGDGSPWAYGQTVTHTYAAAGTYTLSAAAWNGCGMAGPVSIELAVEPPSYRVYLPIVFRTACLGDSFEPDDTPAQARPLLLASPQRHNFFPERDEDWTYVALQAGHTYRFWTEALSGGADTRLYLYAQGQYGSPVAQNDDWAAGNCGGTPPDPKQSCFEYTPAVSGIFDLKTNQYTGGAVWGCQVQYTLTAVER